MDFNIAIILIGSIIVVIALALILKESKSEEELSPQFISELSNYNSWSQRDALEHQKIIEGLSALDNEISLVREQIDKLTIINAVEEQGEKILPSSEHEWENFEHSLNYSVFMQKNNNIIKLFYEGISHEQIAKRLNKSVREVEMVIKLIK